MGRRRGVARGLRNEGSVAPKDPYGARITKTDFLWSQVLHSQPPAKP